MTVQQIADIAARFDNRVADEALRACAVWSYENGIPVSIPKGRMLNAVAHKCAISPVEEVGAALRYKEAR